VAGVGESEAGLELQTVGRGRNGAGEAGVNGVPDGLSGSVVRGR